MHTNYSWNKQNKESLSNKFLEPEKCLTPPSLPQEITCKDAHYILFQIATNELCKFQKPHDMLWTNTICSDTQTSNSSNCLQTTLAYQWASSPIQPETLATNSNTLLHRKLNHPTINKNILKNIDNLLPRNNLQNKLSEQEATLMRKEFLKLCILLRACIKNFYTIIPTTPTNNSPFPLWHTIIEPRELLSICILLNKMLIIQTN